MSASPPVVPLAAHKGESSSKPIILISYPKIVLLYPTFIAAILAGILTIVLGEASPHCQTIGVLFLGILSANVVVLAFDFPRTTSLNLFFVGVALVMGALLGSIYFPNFLPNVTDVLQRINPRANATFYFCFVAMLALIYVAVLINVRFDYWEVRPNELLHHHGFLSSVERYPAPNVRISKEITDVFEYMLLKSGRLIIHPSNERHTYVLDNVLNINTKEAAITKMLSSLQVSVRDDKAV